MSFCFFFNDTATTEIYTLSHTTLFRSPGHLEERAARRRQGRRGRQPLPGGREVDTDAALVAPHDPFALERGEVVGRSEEHTSELQSQSNLVCRLLLEKKKKKKKTIIR